MCRKVVMINGPPEDPVYEENFILRRGTYIILSWPDWKKSLLQEAEEILPRKGFSHSVLFLGGEICGGVAEEGYRKQSRLICPVVVVAVAVEAAPRVFCGSR